MESKIVDYVMELSKSGLTVAFNNCRPFPITSFDRSNNVDWDISLIEVMVADDANPLVLISVYYEGSEFSEFAIVTKDMIESELEYAALHFPEMVKSIIEEE